MTVAGLRRTRSRRTGRGLRGMMRLAAAPAAPSRSRPHGIAALAMNSDCRLRGAKGSPEPFHNAIRHGSLSGVGICCEPGVSS